jgi:CRISPR-associated protein Cas2
MNLLIAYDVSTVSPDGRRRLRRVAQVCLDFGQRVQLSVFECSVSESDFVRLRQRLLTEMDIEKDNLRIYHLHGSLKDVVETHGVNRAIDFEGPLVI